MSSITHVVSESFVVKYHRSCCKSYTSKQNITCFAQKKTTKEVHDSKSSSTVVCSNDITTRSYCIFCKMKSYKKDHKLNKFESQDRMKKILDAARRNSDYEIESKVLHEQFYDKALYHNGCICKYFMKTPKETAKEETESSDHDLAFEKLISDIKCDLMVNHKAFFMSTLLEKYHAVLPEECADKYTSQKLQNRLLRHYGESIIIQSQQSHGRSNIVFSSSVSIGDAINTASQLKSDLKVARMTLQMDEAKQAHTDDQFLHTAANILRRDNITDIHNLDIKNDFYPAPSECSLCNSIQSMPPTLTQFLCWLIDERSLSLQ